MSEPRQQARGTRRGRLRAAFDRVPSAWFASIATGAFLVATAAFGGLGTAAAEPIAELAEGDTQELGDFSVSLERAVLIDQLTEAGIYVEDGQRVLAIVATIVNDSDTPFGTGSDDFGTAFEVDGVQAAPSFARYDDATPSPWLQPSVPARVVIAWPIDVGRYRAGDALAVRVNDLERRTGTFLYSGQYWDDATPSASFTLELSDVGAGAEGER